MFIFLLGVVTSTILPTLYTYFYLKTKTKSKNLSTTSKNSNTNFIAYTNYATSLLLFIFALLNNLPYKTVWLIFSLFMFLTGLTIKYNNQKLHTFPSRIMVVVAYILFALQSSIFGTNSFKFYTLNTILVLSGFIMTILLKAYNFKVTNNTQLVLTYCLSFWLLLFNIFLWI